MEEFSQEQQIVIDKLIKQKYNEAYSKAEKLAFERVAEAEERHKAELTALRGQMEGKDAAFSEEANTLKGRISTLQADRGDSTERVRQALLRAEVSQLNAVNPQQVMKLISDNFIIDDNGSNLAVIDSEKNLRFTADGKPLSAKLFIEEFLASNPHLTKAARSVGSGSFGNRSFTDTGGSSRTMKRAAFDALPDSAKTNFIHSGGRLTG